MLTKRYFNHFFISDNKHTTNFMKITYNLCSNLGAHQSGIYALYGIFAGTEGNWEYPWCPKAIAISLKMDFNGH